MGRDDGAVVVAGVGLSKFAPERPDGTPVDWIVEATQAALDDAGADIAMVEQSPHDDGARSIASCCAAGKSREVTRCANELV